MFYATSDTPRTLPRPAGGWDLKTPNGAAYAATAHRLQGEHELADRLDLLARKLRDRADRAQKAGRPGATMQSDLRDIDAVLAGGGGKTRGRPGATMAGDLMDITTFVMRCGSRPKPAAVPACESCGESWRDQFGHCVNCPE